MNNNELMHFHLPIHYFVKYFPLTYTKEKLIEPTKQFFSKHVYI